ncbi:MAE_28990/MAE_18760 family HEPN-like nuclease [Sphingobacterium sp. 18053]|uniref:MAE_28990/MAE_18760 family HEPN-like nuclease n=1 Tax=Sphingobacterium sp. 18053 TaxID=2681401 RepID=UPI0013583F4E|nr:MAE_28990/MAE_18760 family HEPN-like nuclease [Sphingobacterium sp. 18053]
MEIDKLWEDIESDYSWRIDEIRFFQNQLANFSTEDERDQFRRAIILLLYSHFEGFCKFSFLLYINAINDENIKCQNVNSTIKASSLSSVFDGLRNPDSKCRVFARALPDDSKLHRFSRDIEFLDRTTDFENIIVKIPDNIIDVESNLKPNVLKKILYKLGLDHNLFTPYDATIHKLLGFRNKIAHGQIKEGINKNDFDEIRNAVFDVMTNVKSKIMDALTRQLYLSSVNN